MRQFLAPTHVGTSRLLTLARFLEKLPDEKWDYSCQTAFCHKIGYYSNRQILEQMESFSCGTAGCALGYCPVIFKDLFEYNCEGWVLPKVNHKLYNGIYTNRDSLLSNDMADIFGLSVSQIEKLFFDAGCKSDGRLRELEEVSRQEVIERLYKLIGEQEQKFEVFQIEIKKKTEFELPPEILTTVKWDQFVQPVLLAQGV